MTLRNWPNEFVCGCATIRPVRRLDSLILALAAGALGCWPLAAQTKPSPAIALFDAGDSVQWQNWTRELGWQVIAPPAPAAGSPAADIDSRVKGLAAAVESAIQSGSVDAERVYIAGRGDAVAAIFYAISRVPDLWAAGAVLGGSPKAALDTNRIFTANFTNVPVLWITGDESKPLADKLIAAKLNLEWQSATAGANAAGLLQWLAGHKRDAFPLAIDCETNAPAFARCYWIQPTKFDAGERNDVLASTRVAGGAGAALEMGAFGIKADDPGPGVLVVLPDKYSGPLKAGDRLMALDGRPLSDAKQFQELMDKAVEDRPAVVAVQRGKERIRVETRLVLPRRDSGVTSRVEAQYLPAEKEIQIVSRTITEMRVTVAPQWVPATLLWNGLTLENLKEAGCWALSVQKELLHAEKCK